MRVDRAVYLVARDGGLTHLLTARHPGTAWIEALDLLEASRSDAIPGADHPPR